LAAQRLHEVERFQLAVIPVKAVKLIKSLDRQYGMDEEARKAALQWLFMPARDREGNAVEVLVVIGFDLRLH
jgi:hypothetical protein